MCIQARAGMKVAGVTGSKLFKADRCWGKEWRAEVFGAGGPREGVGWIFGVLGFGALWDWDAEH